mmetsp:Transcript_16658/g.25052  ORF Transcript_16658/g.25052 Transcript_16658/m.25052 type:complete len:321 (-) Transcript_16658:114-1076(-)
MARDIPLSANQPAARGNTTPAPAVRPPARPTAMGCQKGNLCITTSGASVMLGIKPKAPARPPACGSNRGNAPPANAIRGRTTINARLIKVLRASIIVAAFAPSSALVCIEGDGSASTRSPASAGEIPMLRKKIAVAKMAPTVIPRPSRCIETTPKRFFCSIINSLDDSSNLDNTPRLITAAPVFIAASTGLPTAFAVMIARVVDARISPIANFANIGETNLAFGTRAIRANPITQSLAKGRACAPCVTYLVAINDATAPINPATYNRNGLLLSFHMSEFSRAISARAATGNGLREVYSCPGDIFAASHNDSKGRLAIFDP